MAVGALAAGVRARNGGDGFWEGFTGFIREEWAVSAAITGTVVLATAGIGLAAKGGVALAGASKVGAGVGVSGSKTQLPNVVKSEGISINNSLNPNAPSKLTGYTKHGINSAINHDSVGVKTNSILHTLKNPKNITYNSMRKTFNFHSEQAVVVLNENGRVVTMFAKGSKFWRLQ